MPQLNQHQIGVTGPGKLLAAGFCLITNLSNGDRVKCRDFKVQLKTLKSGLVRAIGLISLVSAGCVGILDSHQPTVYAYSMPAKAGGWHVASDNPRVVQLDG